MLTWHNIRNIIIKVSYIFQKWWTVSSAFNIDVIVLITIWMLIVDWWLSRQLPTHTSGQCEFNVPKNSLNERTVSDTFANTDKSRILESWNVQNAFFVELNLMDRGHGSRITELCNSLLIGLNDHIEGLVQNYCNFLYKMG